MRHSLSLLLPEPNPGVVAELGAMNAEPCGIPHHRRWLHEGKDLVQCPAAAKESQVRCIHSNNAVLRAAVREALLRRLLTPVEAKQLDLLLEEDVYGRAWEADMLSLKLGQVVYMNQSGKPYDIGHVQSMTGLSPLAQRVETLTDTDAVRLTLEAQTAATQWRENVRQLLLRLFSGAERDEQRIEELLLERLA
ncbi:MAG TPA: hypothetical protein PKV72_00070 [Candidatus Peribacteria bacterium]|nr:hypothetical protein [Candidatus Peribacteria bacterium]